jgi:hypothetical protein
MDCANYSIFMYHLKIELSPWFKWKDRNSVRNSNQPGVYALSKFETAPPKNADPLDSHIIYFGETCNQSLQQRWKQFDDSAFHQKQGHSGGKTYGNTYLGDKGLDLYVAAMPVLAENEMENQVVRESFIRFAERKLIFDYAIRWKERPICNTK